MSIRLYDVGTILEVTIVDELNVVQDISTATSKQFIFDKPDGTQLTVSASFSTDGTDGKIQYTFASGNIDQVGLWIYRGKVTSPAGTWTSEDYTFTVEDGGKSNIIYLIPYLRLKLGDLNPLAYRYTNDWLAIALVVAVRALGRYWQEKYSITDGGLVTRSTNTLLFITEESSGILESQDEYPIILMAAIILLEGSLEDSAYDAVSWRDNEISFSNLERFRQKDSNLTRFMAELMQLVTPPTKRLARPRKGSLFGYKNNLFEHSSDF